MCISILGDWYVKNHGLDEIKIFSGLDSVEVYLILFLYLALKLFLS